MDKQLFARLKESMESLDKEEKCTECMQYGELNHRGVCEFCEDPYGVSALMELVELEESILRSQE
jgi:recombinational DNA repair protein RecR